MNPLEMALAKRQGSPKENKGSDLAPPNPNMEKEMQEPGEPPMEKTESTEYDNLMKLMSLVQDNPKAASLVEQMIQDQKDEMGQGESAMQEEMESHVSPMDEQVLSNRKPKSLGERVKLEAMERKVK